MAEAKQNSIPPARYSEEARVELRRHIERVAAQRRVTCNGVDFDALWEALEGAAIAYDLSIEEVAATLSARETLGELVKYRSMIEDLLQNCLQRRELFEWDFISTTGSRFGKSERLSLGPTIEGLSSVRDRFTADIADLTRYVEEAEGQKTYAVDKADYRVPVQAIVLDIGRQIFGPAVGNTKGPLITFMRLALEPILGEDTPTPGALQKFAQREG